MGLELSFRCAVHAYFLIYYSVVFLLRCVIKSCAARYQSVLTQSSDMQLTTTPLPSNSLAVKPNVSVSICYILYLQSECMVLLVTAISPSQCTCHRRTTLLLFYHNGSHRAPICNAQSLLCLQTLWWST